MPYTGQQFGNYRLLRLLGEGGFAQVYLGEHIYLKTTAAIKILLANLPQNDSQAFLNEARTVARLRHPHIVRVLEFGVTPDSVAFLAMAYAPAGTLRQFYPEHTRVPLEKVVVHVNQVASALQFAHEQQLIHRDVKPENMLIGHNGEILLSDFGIAVTSQSTVSQDKAEVRGTVIYMAPEQLQGHPRPASDQYSLGVVVYEWLSGGPPFRGANFLATAFSHLQTLPPRLRDRMPDLPVNVEAVVMQALAKDPAERFPSTQAFAQALEEASRRSILASSPTRSLPPESTVIEQAVPTQPLQVRTTRRNLTGVLVGALGLSIAGGGLLWYVRMQRMTTLQSQLKPTPTPLLPARSPGTTLATYSKHTQAVTGVAWSPLDNWIASSSNDQTVQVWSPLENRSVLSYTRHTGKVVAVAWSPNGKYIASTSADQAVLVWNAPYIGSATPGATIFTYVEGSNALAWSPDSQRIASTIGFNMMQVWDAVNGKQTIYYSDPSQSGPGPTSGPLNPVAWSPDGQKIVAGLITLSVWDAASASRILTDDIPSYSAIHGLAWSPDSARVALADGDKTVQIWNTITGETSLIYKGHTAPVYAVAWSPDGKYLVSTGSDKTAQVWEASSGKHLLTYNGHTATVNSVAWARDSQHVVSGGDDKKVLVWQAIGERA